jgi:hypothetical protein
MFRGASTTLLELVGKELTAGAVRCGTARMPDPMLVPTISATAPATLPFFDPPGAGRSARLFRASSSGRASASFLSWRATARAPSPAVAAAMHHLPQPQRRRLLGTRTRSSRAVGSPHVAVARCNFGPCVPRAMVPCIRKELWRSALSELIRWRDEKGIRRQVYIHLTVSCRVVSREWPCGCGCTESPVPVAACREFPESPCGVSSVCDARCGS